MRTKSEGRGGESSTNTGWYGCKNDLYGLWSLTSVRHVYLVGSRNYSNFNNLSAVRLPNKYTSHFDWQMLANEGTPVAVVVIIIYLYFFLYFIYILANNILNQAAIAAADHVLIFNRHFAYQWMNVYKIRIFFFANSILINIIYILHVWIHMRSFRKVIIFNKKNRI